MSPEAGSGFAGKKVYWIVGILAGSLLAYFVFLPAFAGRLIISPVIQIGSFSLRWYGLIMAGSILVGYFLARRHSWKFGISAHDIDDYAFWVIIAGLLGARIYYVLFNLHFFSQHPAEIYQIWHGGLSIYGGLIAGIIFTFLYTRRKAYTFLQLADLVVLSLPLAQALGRFGNFFNQEAFGIPTNLPWKMFVAPEHRPAEFASFNYFHPTFLYEAVADVIVFLILRRLAGQTRPGRILLAYLFSYSLFRFFIESIRIDSLFLYGFRVDQLIAFVLIIFSGIWFLHSKRNDAKIA